MDTRTLIDGIVRQTTVLIAQLSTAAGIRAPLAHVADQVFVELSREIERQGVRQKVAADMFGLALRTYQKKVRRLAESETERNRTLWEAVVGFIAEQERISRRGVEARFAREDDKDLAAVLKDLQDSGLIYATGSGPATLYGVTSTLDREALQQQDQASSAVEFVWLSLFREGPQTREELAQRLPYAEDVLSKAADTLLGDGRAEEDERGRLCTARFVVPVGSEAGWEAAVHDHFQAMASAIAAKARVGQGRSQQDDTVGGATLTFDISADHPMREDVRGLLSQVRQDLNALWERVEAHNAAHPIAEGALERVDFYFGQHAQPAADQEET